MPRPTPTPEKRLAQKRESQRKYRQQHPDRIAASRKKYRLKLIATGRTDEQREKRAKYHKEYYSKHQHEILSRISRDRAENPGIFRERTRNSMRKFAAKQRAAGRPTNLARRGITNEEYDSIIAAQGGACAICAVALPTGRGRHLDHDHVTGRVRGILCGPCNIGIGNLRDSAAIVGAAHRYLLRTQQIPELFGTPWSWTQTNTEIPEGVYA